MNFTPMHVIQFVGAVAGFTVFLKMCWNVAEFAISAKQDIKALTHTLGRLEQNLDDGMKELRARLLTLETKEAIRTATEHIADMEERS